MIGEKTVVTIVSKIVDKTRFGSACLVMIYGPDPGLRIPIDEGMLTIGRSEPCEIQIDDAVVSRRHAELVRANERVSLKDLGSTNGTFVNDLRIEETELRDGDLIKIDHVIFKFLSGENIESSYHDEIYRLKNVDGLTQVFNKRYFQEALDRELSRRARYGRSVSLVLFDIDFFKKVNDTHGHLAGDAVLVHISSTVKAHTRRDDVIARYGGEEFVVILPESALEQAVNFGEKLRQAVAAAPAVYDGKQIAVTVSVGVATAQAASTVETLVKAADNRLYEAKRSGRNRVCA